MSFFHHQVFNILAQSNTEISIPAKDFFWVYLPIFLESRIHPEFYYFTKYLLPDILGLVVPAKPGAGGPRAVDPEPGAGVSRGGRRAPPGNSTVASRMSLVTIRSTRWNSVDRFLKGDPGIRVKTYEENGIAFSFACFFKVS